MSSNSGSNGDEAVILVVGTESRSKSRVADALADAVGAWEVEITHCGVRNFTRKSEVVVVDTLPFYTYYIGEQIFHEIKRWIADNALRRMLRKRVRVVCVISGADTVIADTSNTEETNFYLRIFSWLRFLGDFIFPEHKQSIIFVAVNEDDKFDDDEARDEMWRMRNFIERHKFSTKNITYADLRDRDSFTDIVKSAVSNTFQLERRKNAMDVATDEETFHMIKDLPMKFRNITSLGPWVPERVILFGKSGSGKSTIAQMLTLGRLDPRSEHLKSSSGIRGETTSVHHGEGRGWYVVDTPGFGELKDGSITSEEVERKIKRYVQMIGGIYTHYIYVVRKGRIDKLEAILWTFFVALFGDSIKDHFTVVVTDVADKNWLPENIEHLRKCFLGCESFICTDFPEVHEGDEELETESQQVREESLKELECGLMSLRRSDTWCNFGEWSKMTELDQVSAVLFDRQAMTDGIQRAVNSARIGAYRVSTGLHRLYILLSPEEGRLLLPLEL